MSKKASLLSWLIQVVVWSRVLCSEVYLVGSENTHICEASFSADKRCCWRRGSYRRCCKRRPAGWGERIGSAQETGPEAGGNVKIKNMKTGVGK